MSDIQQANLEHTQDHIHIAFSHPRKVLSSAVLNGGIVSADHLVNLKVAKNGAFSEAPEVSIAQYCLNAKWQGTVVGMMTAALMDSCCIETETVQGIEICVLVTSGLSNARRVGDRAEYRKMAAEQEEIGTINTVVMTSASLSEAAMVEALMIATEAKSAALQEAGVLSPVSNKLATGTGTDACAIVSGHGLEQVNFCGKHVLFGEILGRLVLKAVKSSIAFESRIS